MNELTIIKRGDAAYIDSRQVAEYIGKRHDNLLRDIDGYVKILRKITALNFEVCDFFVESSYTDTHGRSRLCYLITRRGADVIANKLTGEKGVLFTAAYVTKFHQLSEREREREINELKTQAVTPRLQAFNTAVRNVLTGYSHSYSDYDDVMDFLRGAYKPFGIEVASCEGKYAWTATDIARVNGVYSESGLPHGRAVASIIEKMRVGRGHIAVLPYGMVGVTMRYDSDVLWAVGDWLAENDYPNRIPHLDFEYHIFYNRANRSDSAQTSLFDDDYDCGGDWDYSPD